MTVSTNQLVHRYVSWWAITLYVGSMLIQQSFEAKLNSVLVNYKVRSLLASDALVTMSVCLLLVGFGLGLHTRSVNTAANDKASKLVATANNNASSSSNGTGVLASSDVPSTTKPSSDSHKNYTVAPSLPRYIVIPKLGVDARIISVGTDKNGAIATPSNVYDAAWYNQSSLPGQNGAMLIDGHISSWTTKGVFYGLNSLRSGDVVKVERGDGTVYNYRVVKTQIYDAKSVDMSSTLSPVNPAKPGLNLISCFGDVVKGSNEFNKRIVVFTELE